MSDATNEIPEAAERRLQSGAFSSGLSAPDFAACLAMGVRPVGLVQGFCVMKWSWYGPGTSYFQPGTLYAGPGGGGYSEGFTCPHGFVSAEHRSWGQNYEQTWVESAWATGYGSAYERLVDEARELGAHGVIGVVDTVRQIADLGVTEFHIIGTAVVVDGADPPRDGVPWTTYLAGQRLAKLIEAGLVPVAVLAVLTSVRVYAYCMTDYLMEGRSVTWGSAGPQEVDQVSRARMAVRQLARGHLKQRLGSDSLHGVRMEMSGRELGEGDEVVECTVRGTQVRRFKAFDQLPPPVPTVRLS
jgi:uncharacterized protein YbjQ (UPF0145 family)